MFAPLGELRSGVLAPNGLQNHLHARGIRVRRNSVTEIEHKGTAGKCPHDSTGFVNQRVTTCHE